jgi:hypothetical protein
LRNLPFTPRLFSGIFLPPTAYTAESIELVTGAAHPYLVASYTPGLRYNNEGSLTIYAATHAPAGVARVHWLPIPDGRRSRVTLPKGGPSV